MGGRWSGLEEAAGSVLREQVGRLSQGLAVRGLLGWFAVRFFFSVQALPLTRCDPSQPFPSSVPQ